MQSSKQSHNLILILFLISFSCYLINQTNAQTTNSTTNTTTTNTTTNSTTNSTTNTSTANNTANSTNTTNTNQTTTSQVKVVVLNRSQGVNFSNYDIRLCIQQDCLSFTNNCTNSSSPNNNCSINYQEYDTCLKNASQNCDYSNGSSTSILNPICPSKCTSALFSNMTFNTTNAILYQAQQANASNLTKIGQCYEYCYGTNQYNTITMYPYANNSSITNRVHQQYIKLVQAVIEEKAYNDSKTQSNTSGNTFQGVRFGQFVFPLQAKENLSSTKSKRLAIGAAVIIVYMIHYLFVAFVNFLPKEKINKPYFEQVEKFLFLFGFAALLSSNYLQTGLFHAILCYFTFAFLLALHVPVLQMLGLENLWLKIGKFVWLGYIFLLTVWFWGIIIAYYHYDLGLA